MKESPVTVLGLRRALVLCLALVVALAFSFLTVSKQAQAQVVVSGEVLNVLVNVEQGECGTGGCPDDARPVTVTPVLSLNADLAALLTAEQADAVLDAAATVAVFGEITITDSAGNVVATVDRGGTVCLEPGNFTASASVVNAEVTAQAALDALTGLGIDLTGLGIDLSLLVADVLVVEQPFVVAECPVDAVPPPPATDDDQQIGDITVGECLALINNNSGAQYGPSITQECNDIINNIVNNDGDGDGNGNGEIVINITNDLNGDGVVDADDGDLNGDGVVDAGDDLNGDGVVDTDDVDLAAASADTAGQAAGGGSAGGEDAAADTAGQAADGGSAGQAAGISALPDTGGASLLALSAGALLVAGGLLVRRIIQ